ncbi:hypothetical protein Patl1_04285 [Pistacia atlantica]|uniref:Uncharacterized protein n=1 Tax=Pistacia atlantica TaxID=434234 RepID=A0ACC1BTN6_9ROSI|nr:hypothetical protein Patl1_04285 [Pistacia atlantica]
MEEIQYCRVAVVLLCLVIFSRLGYSASKSSGFSIRLIPRDSLESPLYQPNLTQHERIERMVNISHAKDELMTLHSTPNVTFDDKYFALLDRQLTFYVAKIMVGNPAQTLFLSVDTGGGLIWTQCQPCIHCFPQINPIYDPRASFSYQKVFCESPHCNYEDDNSQFDCVNDDCVYSITYFGGGIGPTEGFVSLESFHLFSSTRGDTEEFTVLFGCSNNNQNFQYEQMQNNMVSGNLGLNLDPNSLVSQLSVFIDEIFSYCIVPYDQNFPFDVHPHVLRFGDDVHLPQGDIPTVHYVIVEDSYSYFLDVSDISIGNLRLQLPPGTFDVGGKPGFIIDSGAPYTRIVANSGSGVNVFGLVMTTLRDHYNSYELVRVRQSQHGTTFQLCYFNQPNFRDFPSLTFHFNGADYIVDGRSIPYAKYANHS